MPAPDRTAQGYEWPAPSGWKTETIRFPLEFAPDLAYQGSEELRFPPGFFDPASPAFWSYSFFWWLDGSPAHTKESLEQALTRYFIGLTASEKEKYSFKPERFATHLEEVAGERSHQGHPVRVFRGTSETYDPFKTGRELTLNVEFIVWDCPVAGKNVVFAALSPQPRTDSIWKTLGEREPELSCHQSPPHRSPPVGAH